jgi:hypothetical protein
MGIWSVRTRENTAPYAGKTGSRIDGVKAPRPACSLLVQHHEWSVACMRKTLAALLAVLAFAAPSACSQGRCDPKISRECFR